MRLRWIPIPAFLALAGALVVAFTKSTGRRGPEVKLIHLVGNTVKPPELDGDNTDWLIANVAMPEQETLAALQVASPMGSGIALSPDDNKVEICAPDRSAC